VCFKAGVNIEQINELGNQRVLRELPVCGFVQIKPKNMKSKNETPATAPAAGTDKPLVHQILGWTGDVSDEKPLCGANHKTVFANRTVDASAVTCSACKAKTGEATARQGSQNRAG